MAKVPHNPLEGERPELSISLQSNSEEQVSIIIVHKDRPEYLNICLQSIAVTSMNNNYEIIVVDNNSGQDSQDFLEDIKNEVTVVKNTSSDTFWSHAANLGAQKANKNSKYLVFMHCDVVITNPAWLDLLINVSESSNSGLVGLELQSYYLQNQKVNFVQEWLCLITRDCWEKCGPYEERLPQIGSPFIFTLEAQSKGYKPQVMKNVIAHHYRAFSLDINEYERLIEKSMVVIPQVMREKQGISI